MGLMMPLVSIAEPWASWLVLCCTGENNDKIFEDDDDDNDNHNHNINNKVDHKDNHKYDDKGNNKDNHIVIFF